MTQKNLVEEWIDFQQRGFDSWQKSMNLNQKTNMEEKEEPIPIFGGAYSQQEFIKKMLDGASLYQNLSRFWEDLNTNNSDPLNMWIADYSKIVANNSVSFLPEQMKNFINETLNIYGMSTATINNFSKPWLDETQDLQNLMVKSIGGDQAACIEFNRLWTENFYSSFRKILSIPQFSMNREQMQKQMHLADALINFINTMNKFTATMVKVNQETSQKLTTDYQEMLIAGTNPKTHKEFYDYWWKQNEVAFQKLFGTAEFSKLIAQLLEAGVNCKKELDSLLEKQLNLLPFPSKTDMDSVYKTLDTLKRELRALKKEVATLSEDKLQVNLKSLNIKKQSAKED